jgi:hypothetical protein
MLPSLQDTLTALLAHPGFWPWVVGSVVWYRVWRRWLTPR